MNRENEPRPTLELHGGLGRLTPSDRWYLLCAALVSVLVLAVVILSTARRWTELQYGPVPDLAHPRLPSGRPGGNRPY